MRGRRALAIGQRIWRLQMGRTVGVWREGAAPGARANACLAVVTRTAGPQVVRRPLAQVDSFEARRRAEPCLRYWRVESPSLRNELASRRACQGGPRAHGRRSPTGRRRLLVRALRAGREAARPEQGRPAAPPHAAGARHPGHAGGAARRAGRQGEAARGGVARRLRGGVQPLPARGLLAPGPGGRRPSADLHRDGAPARIPVRRAGRARDRGAAGSSRGAHDPRRAVGPGDGGARAAVRRGAPGLRGAAGRAADAPPGAVAPGGGGARRAVRRGPPALRGAAGRAAPIQARARGAGAGAGAGDGLARFLDAALAHLGATQPAPDRGDGHPADHQPDRRRPPGCRRPAGDERALGRPGPDRRAAGRAGRAVRRRRPPGQRGGGDPGDSPPGRPREAPRGGRAHRRQDRAAPLGRGPRLRPGHLGRGAAAAGAGPGGPAGGCPAGRGRRRGRRRRA